MCEMSYSDPYCGDCMVLKVQVLVVVLVLVALVDYILVEVS